MPAEALNWIIEPAGNCVSYVTEETKLAGLIQRSLITLQGSENLLRLAREKFALHGKPLRALNQPIAAQPTLSQWAKQVIDSDFHQVNSHGLIGIWCAVEVAVEDTVVLILTHDSKAFGAVTKAGIRTSGVAGPVDEEEARRLYRRLERIVRANHPVGEAYGALLSIFGLDVRCPARELAILAEINSVRNCLLHRAGVIDGPAAAQAPALKPFVGKTLPITSARYQKYFSAIGEFAQALMRATLKSKYVKVQLLDPQPATTGPQIELITYEPIREAIRDQLAAVGTDSDLRTFQEAVAEALPSDLSARVADIPWHVAVVMRDLAARGELRILHRAGGVRVAKV